MVSKNNISLILLFISPLVLFCAAQGSLEGLKAEVASLRKQLKDLEVALPGKILSTLRKEITENHDFNGCGGTIDATKVTNLTYLRPAGSISDPETCIWILWTNETTKIGLTLQSLQADDNSTTKFVVHSNLWADSLNDVAEITTENLNKEVEIDSYLAVLVFSSNSTTENRGFNLTLRSFEDLKSTKVNETEFGIVKLNIPNNLLANEILWTLSYPIEGGEYTNFERSFFLFYPGRGRKMLLTVDFSDTEPHVDFLSVFVFSKEESKFLFDTKFSGRKQRGDYRYESEEGSPILLYFHSDSSSFYDGFKVSYRYYKS